MRFSGVMADILTSAFERFSQSAGRTSTRLAHKHNSLPRRQKLGVEARQRIVDAWKCPEEYSFGSRTSTMTHSSRRNASLRASCSIAVAAWQIRK
jgi:hypothetical protein